MENQIRLPEKTAANRERYRFLVSDEASAYMCAAHPIAMVWGGAHIGRLKEEIAWLLYTQLREANERAEELAGYVLNLRAELASTRVDAERELEEERELCDAIAQQRQRLELQVTELEAKQAAVPDAEGAD